MLWTIKKFYFKLTRSDWLKMVFTSNQNALNERSNSAIALHLKRKPWNVFFNFQVKAIRLKCLSNQKSNRDSGTNTIKHFCCSWCHHTKLWQILMQDLRCFMTSVTRLGNFLHFGNHSLPLATIILPKSNTLLGNFC